MTPLPGLLLATLLQEAVATDQQGDLIECLRARHGARLAGAWVDTDPGWHSIVQLTGTVPPAPFRRPTSSIPDHWGHSTSITAPERR
ncbi:hypothetical protein [Stenotrophomonas cyclobalanopsidis]|uniref:hypothetical protein n=1 Tax=Stenotrophomonas cyclobalanopsidis TaxID=2771362 RepID=UPI00165FC837|nr:hypothetical protein [Stenotrophomonas cyclobalanopsidis]